MIVNSSQLNNNSIPNIRYDNRHASIDVEPSQPLIQGKGPLYSQAKGNDAYQISAIYGNKNGSSIKKLQLYHAY